MVHALRSRRVVTAQGVREAFVVIDGECIVAVKAAAEMDGDIAVENWGDVALLPGMIDAHTHINEPGRTEWEGFATATRAAAGGFTTVVDMPLNSLPETTDVGALELKREAAQGQCLVDVAFWGGCVDGNQAELEPLALAGVAGFKSFLIYPGCDGFTEIDRDNLELALPHIVKTSLPLLVHAELAPSIDAAVARLNAAGADWRRYETYLASRPDEAELEAIEMLIGLCRKYRFRLHIVHLSTAQALGMIRSAKQEGLPLTAEACPHHLHVTAEQIADGATLFKCTPPIRSAANRELLWEALKDGTLDLIATDHSPCPIAMKRLTATEPGMECGRFDEAWGGIASLSTAVSVVWTECVQRGIGLEKLVEWMSAAPARLAGIASDAGGIAAGMHANLVAFDAEAEWVVSEDRLHYKHKCSPYMGETLKGVVRSTWVRGRRVFDQRQSASFAEACEGKEFVVGCGLDR
jgi:allantoinase